MQLGELMCTQCVEVHAESASTKTCYWPAMGSCYSAYIETFRTSQVPAAKLLAHQSTLHTILLLFLPLLLHTWWDLVTWWGVCFLFWAFGDQNSLCSSGLKLAVICFRLPSAEITGMPHNTWPSLGVLNTFSIAKIYSYPVGSPAVRDLLYKFSF